MILGPVERPAATTDPVIEDKTHAVTPAAMKVKAGLVTGEMTKVKVTERVEKGVPGEAHRDCPVEEQLGESDRPSRRGQDPLHRRAGQPIKLEDMRTEPTLTFSWTPSPTGCWGIFLAPRSTDSSLP